MAKRTNPFIEDFVPQSKVHIGMKQFNNNEERLKKVYEKTLLLLFKGAKKCPAQEVNTETPLNASDRQDKMKQMFIGKDGTLLHSGNLVGSKTEVKPCMCGSLGETRCAYCELSLCCRCQHMCVRCQQPHCLCCTMVGSEGSEVCTSCYS